MDDLRAYLDDPARPLDTMVFEELQGFLFAVVNAPDLVLPSEWLPEVFAGAEEQYQTVEEAGDVHLALLEVYNAVNDACLQPTPALPPGCEPRADVLSNLEDDAPLSRWARGFSRGYGWLEETWDALLPEDDELDHDMGAVLATLSFFASREMAETFCAELGDKPLPEMAVLVLESLPMATHDYIAIGRTIARENMAAPLPVRAALKTGRNEPCPCGSGRKYKKCCGGAVH